MKSHFYVPFLLLTLVSCSKPLSEMTGGQVPDLNQNPDIVSSETEQAIHFYANGSQVHSSHLNNSGLGFIKLFLNRNRAWGSNEMMRLITETAHNMKSQFPNSERLQVGDIAAESGGPISGHGSHQNGLDADLVYFRVNRQEQDPNYNSNFAEYFVIDGKISSNFDVERNYEMLKKITSSKKINRIFVDGVIKKTLCDYASTKGELISSTEMLRSLRPWPNHAHHFHVRLNCPVGSPRCTKQEDPPLGHGCEQIQNPSVTIQGSEGC